LNQQGKLTVLIENNKDLNFSRTFSSLSTHPPSPTAITGTSRQELVSESSLSSEEVFSPVISPREINPPQFKTTNPHKNQHQN
jgi:hypothetical protein